MNNTATLNGITYTLACITMGVAKRFPLRNADDSQLAQNTFNERLIVASLVAGGLTDEAAQQVFDSVPYYSLAPDGGDAFKELFEAAVEVNGLQRDKSVGEEKAGEKPAAETATTDSESTSDSATTA